MFYLFCQLYDRAMGELSTMYAVSNELDFEEVERAEQRLRGVAHRTPVLQSSTLNAWLGAEVFFKCENFQRVGAFKFRGGYNAVARLTPEQRARGVITYSSGNMAQAVALAARMLTVHATIVMPADAPQAKKAATQGYGATIVEYDRHRDDRESLTRQLAEQQGLYFIPPFGDEGIIAGQGTAAKELFDDVGELDRLYVPIGGGGLLSGSLLSAKALSPACEVFGVEPELGNDAQQSLRLGQLVRIATPQTIADGAQTQALSSTTYNIIRHNVTDIVTVNDQQLLNMLRFFAERMKMVVEPTGCLAAAAAVQAAEQIRGKRVGVIVSGGNLDSIQLCKYLALGQALQCQPDAV